MEIVEQSTIWIKVDVMRQTMNKKCQVFTPSNYVEELLDCVGYTENLYGKKILENSCGEGNVLVVVVQRYIDDCKRQGLSRTKIKNGLFKDIYGVEIDPEKVQKCIKNLNDVLVKNSINQVNWQICNEDYLRKSDTLKYEFIVGNPPYITYKEMDDSDRKFLKDKFESCKKGKFDYCYAFIEKSIKSLAKNGKMSYLVPSSIFKTVYGSKLRECMKPHIKIIRDYTQERMFDNALVKSAIMVLGRNKEDSVLYYTDVTLKVNLQLPIDKLTDKWFFTSNIGVGERRFGDFFKVSHVVATLLNKAFVLRKENIIETEDYFVCNDYNIEKEIVKKTATPRSLRYDKTEMIIFPYYYDNGQLKKYSEEEFVNRFPGAAEYLNSFREQLDERESDDGAKWYEYGRSQALNNLNSEKLLISTVITSDVMVYKLDQNCIPYAGMYIVIKDNNDSFSLDEAMDILRSRNFVQYVLDVGIHISGTSLRITSKDIEEYRF